MTSQIEIAIPTTSTSTTSKPYTIYNITLRLPLCTFTLQKRYSDFVTLNSTLASQAGAPPQASLPAKFYFTSTTSSPALAETRRQELESYLQTLNTIPDSRWRNTPAWRSFLNLPSTSNARLTAAAGLHSAVRGPGSGQPITDPVVWLDYYRDLKTQLHDARVQLARRDQATAVQAQHECSAQAKKCLVKAGTMIATLDQGLQNLGSDAWGKGKLGPGEMRQRKDLVASARKEKEGLENLLNAMVAKSSLDATIASAQDKAKLVGDSPSGGAPQKRTTGGRVLGKETDRTRALDNEGVLQLQQQLMREQDEDVDVLAQAVARQKQIGIDIQEELDRQKVLLTLLDEDVDRTQGKMNVAKNRIGKLS